MQYQKELGFKTLSKAADQIFKEFFEMLAIHEEEEEKETLAQVKQELSEIRQEFNQRFDALEEKLRRIEQQQEEEED